MTGVHIGLEGLNLGSVVKQKKDVIDITSKERWFDVVWAGE